MISFNHLNYMVTCVISIHRKYEEKGDINKAIEMREAQLRLL